MLTFLTIISFSLDFYLKKPVYEKISASEKKPVLLQLHII